MERIIFFYGKDLEANKRILTILSNKGLQFEIAVDVYLLDFPYILVGNKTFISEEEIETVIYEK